MMTTSQQRSLSEDDIVRQVMAIVNDGYNVIEVDTSLGARFYVYDSIEMAYKGSSTSVSYNSFKGTEITPFIYTPRDTANNPKAYKQAFENYLFNRQPINVKFSEITEYITYTG